MNPFKIAAKSIEITFSESPDVKEQTFATFAEVDAHLRRAVARQPSNMLGYHKTGFVITFADGETYEGRIDLAPGEWSIGEHVTTFCSMYSGRQHPAHMTEHTWARTLNQMGVCRTDYAKFLDTYALTDAA